MGTGRSTRETCRNNILLKMLVWKWQTVTSVYISQAKACYIAKFKINRAGKKYFGHSSVSYPLQHQIGKRINRIIERECRAGNAVATPTALCFMKQTRSLSCVKAETDFIVHKFSLLYNVCQLLPESLIKLPVNLSFFPASFYLILCPMVC